jgi:hypothetical protein
VEALGTMQRYRKKILAMFSVTLIVVPAHSLNSYQIPAPTPQEEVIVELEEPDPEPEFIHVNPEEDEQVGEKPESDVDYSEVCNCWQYVKNNVPGVTSMAAMTPNSEPVVGSVAIEWFGSVKHVSVVVEVTESGVLVHETNYRRCQFTERFIDFSSHRLAGFWTPLK